MDHHGWARRFGHLLLIALLAAVALGAADDDEWDPAGDHKKITASPPTSSAPTNPSAEEAVVKAADSPALKPFVAKLAGAAAKAMQGDYAGARSLAKQSATEVANVGVTSDFIKTRAALTAAFTILGGEMDAILGQGTAANRAFGQVKTMSVSEELKAQAAESEAYAAMLDYDFNLAASLERRARQHRRDAIQPAMAGAAMLYSGQAGQALDDLEPCLGQGQNSEFVALYAAAAALCLDRASEASSYFGRPEVSAAGYWPNYYLIGGLLDGAAGSVAGAQAKFAEGARREHSRFHPNAALAAVASMASGQAETAVSELHQAMRLAPPNFRSPLADLMARPSAAAAAKALATPRIWLTANGYKSGELIVPDAALPEMPETPATPEGTELPATPEEPDAAAPDVAVSPLAGGPAPASTTTTTAPVAATNAPPDDGVTSINPTTQAATAYRSALAHIANHRYAEAETALDYAIRYEAFPEALLARGQLRYLRGDYRGAASDYGRAVKLRPDWGEAVYSLAQATDQLGDPGRASEMFKVALELGLPPALAEYARSRAGGR